jgi:hypothetical protein
MEGPFIDTYLLFYGRLRKTEESPTLHCSRLTQAFTHMHKAPIGFVSSKPRPLFLDVNLMLPRMLPRMVLAFSHQSNPHVVYFRPVALTKSVRPGHGAEKRNVT